MNNFWIYKITNKITGKIYIGQTKNLYDRLKAHKACRDKNTIIVKSIIKYGWDNHCVEILFFSKGISRKEADNLEIYFIKKNNSYCKNNPLGMNLTEGGYRGNITIKTYANRDKNNHNKWVSKIGKVGIPVVYYSISGEYIGELIGESMKEMLIHLGVSKQNKINEVRRWLSKNKWTSVNNKYIIGFADSSPYDLYLSEKIRKRNHALSVQNSPGGRQNLIDYHKKIHDKPVLDLNTGVFFETITEFCFHEGRSPATILERFEKEKYKGKYLLCRN